MQKDGRTNYVNKNYFVDENKGIIYDCKYNVIGNIDEFGNPNINP